MPVRRVELGNEVYLNTPVLVRRFPTPRPTGARPPAGSMPSSAISRTPRSRRPGETPRRPPRTTAKRAGPDGCSKPSTGRPRSPSIPTGGLAARPAADRQDGCGRSFGAATAAWPAARRRHSPAAEGSGRAADRVDAAAQRLDARHLGARPVERRVPAGTARRAPGAPGGPPRADLEGAGRGPVLELEGIRGRPGTVQFGRTAVGAASGEPTPRRRAGRGARAPGRHAPRIPGTRLAAVRAAAVKAEERSCSTSPRTIVSSGWSEGRPAAGPWTRCGRARPRGSRVEPDISAMRRSRSKGRCPSPPTRSTAWSAERGGSRNPGTSSPPRPALAVRSRRPGGSRPRVGGEGEATCLDLVRQSPFRSRLRSRSRAARMRHRAKRPHRGSRPLSARPAAGYHQIPTAFAGFNSPFRKNPEALSPRLSQAAAGLAPGALRVFGETTANYWDWRKGRSSIVPASRDLRRANRG